jgi:hypothetical protein
MSGRERTGLRKMSRAGWRGASNIAESKITDRVGYMKHQPSRIVAVAVLGGLLV